MITKITGEQPFQVLTNNFSISPSNEGYTLQISADGKQYSNLFTVGAGVTRLVTGVAANSYYRLSGNQSQVSINWMKVCVTEGGGGASGTELSPVSEFPAGAEAGTVIAYSGSSSAAGIYQFDGTDWVEAGGNTEDIELPIAAAVNDLKENIEARLNQKYYTRQEVNDIAARKTEPGQVNVQIQDYVDPAIEEVNETIEDKELPVSAAINDLNQKISEISGGSSGDLSAYWTSAETKTYVDNRLDGYEEESTITITSTRDAENLDVYVAAMGWMGANFSLYLTDADVEVATLDNAQMRQDGSPTYVPGLSDFLGDNRYGFDTSAVLTEAMLGQKFSLSQGAEGKIELNETNFPVSYPQYFVLDKANMEGWFTNTLSTSVYVPGVVKSDGEITKVKKLTQAEYDAITTKDPNTFYIIVNN